MGLLCDYFLAASPAEAETTLDWIGGPDGPPAGTAALPTVALRGIEPTMWMGKLEEQLTGRSFEQILDDPSGELVGMRDEGERVVVSITTTLQDALAALAPDDIPTVAARWGEPDAEYGTEADPAFATEALAGLVQLVRAGRAAGSSLYCWVCV